MRNNRRGITATGLQAYRVVFRDAWDPLCDPWFPYFLDSGSVPAIEVHLCSFAVALRRKESQHVVCIEFTYLGVYVKVWSMISRLGGVLLIGPFGAWVEFSPLVFSFQFTARASTWGVLSGS